MSARTAGACARGAASSVASAFEIVSVPSSIAAGSPSRCGQISATVSARSPTKSRLIANSSGSTRVATSPWIAADLIALMSIAPVSAAIAQPRSGSGVARR